MEKALPKKNFEKGLTFTLVFYSKSPIVDVKQYWIKKRNIQKIYFGSIDGSIDLTN